MKILAIELCNYEDYPTGGQLSFVRNMMCAFGNKLLLAGCSTDSETPVGVWSTKILDNIPYRFFSVQKINAGEEKPFIPRRVSGYLALKKYINAILEAEFDQIFIQAPEVLFSIPRKMMGRVTIVLPGVNNPLIRSRYSFLRFLSGPFGRIFYRRLSSAGHIMATASREEIKKFVDSSPCPLPEITQFPTRYDSSIFRPMDKLLCRSRLGLDSKGRVFVTVGRLNRGKGWELMLGAFSRLQLPGNNLLVFIGNGEDEEVIRQKADLLGIQAQVLMTGRLDAVSIALYLNAADVFVMGSVAEGWSTTLVEACACGVPCVVTDFSSASDMIEDGRNGYVVKSRDVSEFAVRMSDALRLNREDVRNYDRRFSNLAVKHLADEMFRDEYKPKVLFLCPLPPPVHGSSLVSSRIRDSRLIQSTFDCTFSNISTSLSVQEIGTIRIVKLSRYLKSLYNAAKALLSNHFDVCYLAITCHGRGFLKDAPFVLMCKASGGRVLIHQHNRGMSKDVSKPIFRRFLSFVYKNTEVILLSEVLYDDISAIVPRSSVRICPNGIPDKYYTSASRNPSSILFLSNLYVSKGVFVLLDALQILGERGIAFTCRIAGGQTREIDEDRLLQQIHIRNLEQYVTYEGSVCGNAKDELYKKSGIFVLPTQNECFPLVLLEAMRASLACVSTRVGGIPDIIDDGITGLLIDSADSAVLADALEKLLKDRNLCYEMGRSGRRRYEDRFTSDEFEGRLIEILR